MKKTDLEKGFTLIEILITITIISILFITLIPQVDGFYHKVRETGIKSDFRDFQIASEAYFRENGKQVSLESLNMYLDQKHKVIEFDSIMQTNSLDSWGRPYEVEFGIGKIMFTSYGKEMNMSDKKYITATYYHNDYIASCTGGFLTTNIVLTMPSIPSDFICGEDIISATSPIDTLDKPGNFKASNVTNTHAELSWDAVSGADLYILKRNGMVIYSGSHQAFSDLTLSPWTTYTYSVIAKNTKTLSPPSTLNVTTDGPPHAPTGFKANNITAISASLSWNHALGTTQYVLRRDGIIVYTGNSTIFHDTGLTEYTSYSYSLTAQNSNGQSIPTFLIVKTLATEETIKLPDIGTGSCNPYNPYIVTTIGELQGMKLKRDGCFELGNDIDASSTASWNNAKGFVPVGYWDNDTDESYGFKGNMDGKNYKIKNLYINRPYEDDIGLFGVLDNGTIKNLNIQNAMINGKKYVGVLAGYTMNISIIQNSTVSGSARGEDRVGGLIGYSDETKIMSSVSEVTVNSLDEAGGLISTLDNSEVTDSKAIGNVTGNLVAGLIGISWDSKITKSKAIGDVKGYGVVGGLVGWNSGTDVLHSSSEGLVEGDHQVGGLIGDNNNNSTISYSFSIGDVVSSSQAIGGLVGNNSDSNILNSYSLGDITGGSSAGGFIGSNYNAIIKESYSKGNVTGDSSVGGFIGSNYNAIIKESHSEGIVTGEDYIGGFIGVHNASKIENAHHSGQTNGNKYVGGFIGKSNDSTVENAYSDANTYGKELVGGFIGRNDNTIIINSSAKGNVDGFGNWIGGFSGYHSNSTIENSFALGKVTGANQVGGFVGRNEKNSIIKSSYSLGDVNGTLNTVGGFAGYHLSSTIESSFAVGNVTGATNSVGGFVGKSETNSVIKSSYALGNVTGDIITGGFIGYNADNSKVIDSFARGEVNGRQQLGGFAGDSRNSTIEKSYATGKVSATSSSYIGGFLGYNVSSTIINSYYDKNSTGLTTSNGGIGRTTAELQQTSTYTGWDFINIWTINPLINDGYPYIKNNPLK